MLASNAISATMISDVVTWGVDIRHLQYFVAVADELHFARAASRLRISQPPLSRRIAELERELSVQLFVRTSRSVEITSSGTKLLPLAREALRAFDAVRAGMAQPLDGDGSVRVALPPDTDPGVLSVLQRALTADRVELEWSEAVTAEGHEALLAGRVDVAVLRLPVSPQGLWVSPALSQPLGILSSRVHTLAGTEPVLLSSLQGKTLLMFSRVLAPGMYDRILSDCGDNGFRPHIVKQGIRATASLMVKSELSPGRAVMLVPSGWGMRLGDVTWTPIKDEPLRWETAVCSRLGEERLPVVKMTIRLLFRALQECEGWRVSGSRS